MLLLFSWQCLTVIISSAIKKSFVFLANCTRRQQTLLPRQGDCSTFCKALQLGEIGFYLCFSIHGRFFWTEEILLCISVLCFHFISLSAALLICVLSLQIIENWHAALIQYFANHSRALINSWIVVTIIYIKDYEIWIEDQRLQNESHLAFLVYINSAC